MKLHSYLYTINIIILSLFISGCGGSNAETNIPNISLHQGLIKDAITQTPLVDVEVTIQNKTVYTDKNGFYTISDLIAKDEETITYKKSNYMTSSKIISIKTYSDDSNLSLNFLELNMHKYTYQYTHSSSEQVFHENSYSIELPNNIYKDINNTKYNKEIHTNILYKNTTTKNNKYSFPGLYEGVDSNGIKLPLIAYAILSINIEDHNKNKLIISDSISVTFKNIQDSTMDIIPLWYYNYEEGTWIEDGYATRLENGYYQGTISHTGTWSLSQVSEEEAATYTGYIINEEGLPMTNIRLDAIGNHWIQRDLSTDENGIFEIKVIPNREFKLYAYNYHDKYGASFRRIIPAINPGEIGTK